MVFFNHATRNMTVKIVYYGPGLCGKTTNLHAIYSQTSRKGRGEMVSLNTETDRTLFFDLLPLEAGLVGGYRTRLQLYTVPGQVFYNETRKLVLQGVDGIVFVVDSQAAMLDAGCESMLNLRENIGALGLDLAEIPMVFQWNKRDLRSVVPVEDLETTFNSLGLPTFQAVASEGTGVFETLRGITHLALSHIKEHALGDGPATPVEIPASDPTPSPLTLQDLQGDLDFEAWDRALSPEHAEAEVAVPLPDEDLDTTYAPEEPLLPDLPSVLSLDLDLNGETVPLDLIVQVTVGGRVLAEGTLKVPAPTAEASVPVQLELRRS
ncbi:MAG: GTPase domain-containing protein [Holophagaceae bacterium]